MTDQSSYFLLILVGLLALAFLWLLSIAFTFWDLRRREGREPANYIWLVVVTLVPFFGFLGYLFGRTMPGLFGPREPTYAKRPRRETLLKPPPDYEVRRSTIAAADLLRGSGPAPYEPVEPASSIYTHTPSYVCTLHVLAGPHAGETFVLRETPAGIGRGSGAFIRLDNDLGVSRRHAELYQHEGTFWVRDLGSTHGTLLNGQPVSEMHLTAGDEIQVGQSILRVNFLQG